MVDYSLWEVIENGNKPLVTIVVEGVETIIAPATAEEKGHRSNEAVNIAFGVTTAGTQVNIANSTNIDNLSDAIICAFLASQSNSSQLVNEDLKQIYLDDLEKMDLKWPITILTMRARRFLKNTGRKLNLNGNETVVFDKTKVKCYNCHKRGYFARESLVSCDGLGGYDWSDQAEEGPNYALMTYSTSSSDSEKPEVETSDAKASAVKPKVVRKNNGSPLIEDCISDSKDEAESKPNIEKKTVKPSFAKIEFVKSNEQVKSSRKTTVKHVEKPRQHTHRPRVNAARQKISKAAVTVNTARPVNTAHQKKIMNAVKPRPKAVFNTARPKAVFNTAKGNEVYAFKASACGFGNQKPKSKSVMAWVPKRCRFSYHICRIMKKLMKDMLPSEVISKEGKSLAKNRVLVVKPHNKTPYALFHDRMPMLSFMRPFECPVTILNTIDHLGKFDGKANEGFFVGYSLNSKAFRVFNSRTRIVEETFNIRFSKNTPNNPVVAGTQSNGNACTKDNNNACQARKEKVPSKDYILLPLLTDDPPFLQEPKSSQDTGFKPSNDVGKKVNEVPRQKNKCKIKRRRTVLTTLTELTLLVQLLMLLAMKLMLLVKALNFLMIQICLN
nr:ribonuclease H-like domain-containing protein [Tanacetum cinerariifolium]